MESKHISKQLMARVPHYLAYLRSLPESVENISATRIACDLKLGEVLVRKDLAKISNAGRCRLGYPRAVLLVDMEAFLSSNFHGAA